MILAALAITIATSTWAATLPERRYEARLVRVIDGDSIEAVVTARATVHLPGEDIELATSRTGPVRLAGVDAPEVRGECEAERKLAREARMYLEDRLRGQPLVLVTRGNESEKFGRVLADVEVDGHSVARELVQRGLAFPYGGEKRASGRWCSS